MNSDEQYMRRCITLAECATGLTYPNPMVGCVIVCDGKIIGEGYHRKAGEGHAEVNAIASVRKRKLLNKSTLYVSLEPCAHYGKTPPCAKLIIDCQIPKVVVGCVDSFSAVAGKGIQMLRDAGIEVIVGVLERECRRLNRRFFTFHEKRRPYVTLKWAESADGFIDSMRDDTNLPTWLTDEECRRLVHKQRTEEQAIMIGANTALLDRPQLTARLWSGNQPTRIIIDPNLRVPRDMPLFTDGKPTIVINKTLDSNEANVKFISCNFSENSAANILSILHNEDIQSVIIEGGTKTLQSFIDANLWDEAFVYKGFTTIGRGVIGPQISSRAKTAHLIGSNQLFIYCNNNF